MKISIKLDKSNNEEYKVEAICNCIVDPSK